MSRLQMILDEVDSTQLELKRQFASDPFLQDYSFVHAYAQSTGRGRQDRAWNSCRGNLYLSILLRGPFDSMITWIPHRLAIAMAESLLQVGVPEARLRIKWPNDLIIDGTHKISGVLAEKVGENIIAGIGVNVLIVPTGIGRPVTSVQAVLRSGGLAENQPLGDESDCLSEDSIIQIRDQFLEELSRARPLREIQKKYQQLSLFQKGDLIRWQDETSAEIQRGQFERIGEFGEMVVSQNGREKPLFSEEVHLRASIDGK
jgi:biotin-[acetyl-CoA-carboxylase] ligase BirA-like protein